MGEVRWTWRGPTGPFEVSIGDGVFKPSSTSLAVAEALEIRPGDTVADLGCGCGVLSFVAARKGAGRVFGSDISVRAVETARRNAEELGLAQVTEFRAGDLIEPLRGVVADVVIGDVSGIPDAIAEVSGWFPGGHAGGPTGAELPVRMLRRVGEILRPGGTLYLPTGSIQAEEQVLRAARAGFGMANLEVAVERHFPLPELLARSAAVARLLSDGVIDLQRRGSRWLWRLRVWRCTAPA